MQSAAEKRAYNARRYRAIKADPAKWAAHRAYHRRYAKEHVEARNARMRALTALPENKPRQWKRQQNDRVKNEVYVHYGERCAYCGVDDRDVLCIDHVNNDGAAERRQFPGQKIYRLVKRRGFPPDYQILCANCNLKKETLHRRAKAQEAPCAK